jgi:hypothetical protein
MKWLSPRRPTSVIALSVSHGQLRFAHAARAKQALAVLQAGSAPLTLDLGHPEPELVGQEIRNHLDAAGLRERHCVVALPAEWILLQQSAVPADLSAEDTAGLLQLEAEKGFPCALEELQVARSPQRSATAAYVSQLAVRQEQLGRLDAILRAAGLKPVSFTLGLAALPHALGTAEAGRVTLLLEPQGATLLIAAGGGIATLRTLEATIDSEVGEHVINAPALGRELRISLEQLPADLRASLTHLALHGEPTLVAALAKALAPWAREAGLALETGDPAGRPATELIVDQLALRFLQGVGRDLEFLPPKPSRWAALATRYSSRRLTTAGFAAAGVLGLVALGFGWQEFSRWSLRSEWEGMAAQVGELEGIQARIREFRPWYDETFRELSILRRVTECFPDSGSVSAKSFEFHGPNNVSVSGSARDNASLLRTLDQLRQAKEVQGLKIEQIRGKTPAQFTFTFRWVGTPGS